MTHLGDVLFLTKSAETDRASCVWFHAWLTIPSVVSLTQIRKKQNKTKKTQAQEGEKNPQFYVLDGTK